MARYYEQGVKYAKDYEMRRLLASSDMGTPGWFTTLITRGTTSRSDRRFLYHYSLQRVAQTRRKYPGKSGNNTFVILEYSDITEIRIKIFKLRFYYYVHFILYKRIIVIRIIFMY